MLDFSSDRSTPLFAVDWVLLLLSISGMIVLLRKLFWFALFLVFTLGFVTLFDHGWNGPQQFVADAKLEADAVTKLWTKPIERKKDASDQIGK